MKKKLDLTTLDAKWLIAGGLLVLVIGLISTFLFLTSDIGKKPKAPDKPVSTVEAPKKETDSTDEEETITPVTTNYQERIPPVGYGDAEYPAAKSNTLKSELLRFAEKGEIDALLEEMERYLAKYRFSQGVNLEIAGLYADASFTKELAGKTEQEMRTMLPDAYLTPEFLAIMPLYLPEMARRDMIHDSLSLTPLTEGGWSLNGTRTIETSQEADEDEVYQDNGVATSMFNVVDGISRIRIFDLSRDEEPEVVVHAYLAELANGTYSLYGYYISDDVTHYYQTVDFFRQLDEDYIQPNADYQQERIQEELDEGNLPPEVLDEFLNPTQ